MQKLLTTNDLMEYLQIGKNKCLEILKAEREDGSPMIRAFKVGRKWLASESAVQEYIEYMSQERGTNLEKW